jgi:hypothetical protein
VTLQQLLHSLMQLLKQQHGTHITKMSAKSSTQMTTNVNADEQTW